MFRGYMYNRNVPEYVTQLTGLHEAAGRDIGRENPRTALLAGHRIAHRIIIKTSFCQRKAEMLALRRRRKEED